jgi:hypothetical protein
VISVRELGPVVKLFGSPALLESETDVLLDLHVLDVRSGSVLASFQTHWQNSARWSSKASLRCLKT